MPANPQGTVEEARRGVETGNLHPMRHDIFCARLDALIAAAHAEGRREATDNFLALMSSEPEEVVRNTMVRAATLREVRERVEATRPIMKDGWAGRADALAAIDALEGK